MADKIIEGTTIISNVPDKLLQRSLSVGFFHALGARDSSYGGYSESDYKFLSHSLYEGGGGTASWQPTDIRGPSVARATEIGLGEGGSRDLRLGAAANWSDSLGGEDIKKEILPTVAWHKRANLSQLFKSPGQLGWDTSNVEKRAKSYVWKQMNKAVGEKENVGWGSNDPPEAESYGFSSNYVNLIREKSKFTDKAQAADLLASFIRSATDNTAGVVAFGDVSVDSAEEAALRLWPYVKDSVATEDIMDENGTIIQIAGEVSRADLQRGVNEMLDTAGERRMTTYDIQSSMAAWDEIESSLRQAGVSSAFELKPYVEVTKQEQRISKKVQKDLDLSNQINKTKLKKYMEEQLDMAILHAIKSGGAIPYDVNAGSDASSLAQTFAGEATRRMEEVFDWRALNHTWIEPVRGGIGLYNVHIPAQMLGSNEAVPSSVSITFLPTPTDLTGIVTGLGANVVVERYLNSVGAGGLGAVFDFAGIDYIARFKTQLGMYQQGFQEGYTPHIRTRATIMPEGQLTETVYKFITNTALTMFEDGSTRAKAKSTKAFSLGFQIWAKNAVSQIAKYGKDQANKLKGGSYKSWVQGPLTHGVDAEGEPREYGNKGSSQKFIDRLDTKLQNTLYQPKPFMWLRSAGVQERAKYKGGIRRSGPIGK